MVSQDLRIIAAGATHKGMVREHNEDSFLLVDLDSGERPNSSVPTDSQSAQRVEWSIGERGVLLAVSDGMGGAAAGEVASTLSVEALLAELQRDDGDGAIPDRLRRVVLRASKRVREEGKRPGRRGMGATLTAALLCGTTANLAQIGDSRAYLIRGGAIRQVTHDQSYVQMLVDEGVMTAEEAERSPQKNVLLQAMGQPGDLKVGLGRIAVQRGDRLLLCSDGLTNAVPDHDIATLAVDEDTERACAALIATANKAGGPDNITVVLGVVM
jgi:PPM family protein phosphatase